MSYDGWESIDRSREAFRKRIEELDKKHVKSAREISKIFREMTSLARQEIRCAITVSILRAFENLVRNTPVDTGRLRAGWRISDSGAATLPEKGIYPEFQDDNSISLASIMASSIDQGTRLTKADVLWIYNNVEYVLALNAGWSTRQAGGFIDTFLDEVKGELEKLARE